jgi:hypothetical protein
MRPLIIDNELKALAANHVAEARKTPVSLVEVAKKLDAVMERKENKTYNLDDTQEAKEIVDRPKPWSMEIPFGYRAAVSFEEQPTIGLCVHLSISVDTPGRLPSIPAIKMIADSMSRSQP